MEHTTKEERDGVRWLIGAGLVAAGIAGFIVWSDHTLSTSPREENLSDTLLELRTAQHSLPTGVTDQRQTQSYLPGQSYDVEPVREENPKHGAHHGHGDAAAHEHPEDKHEPHH